MGFWGIGWGVTGLGKVAQDTRRINVRRRPVAGIGDADGRGATEITEETLMIFDPFDRYSTPDYVFKIARLADEIEGYWELRRAIFCEEQKIFKGTDRDEIDATAIPIVCRTVIAGMEDTVAGVVRIDERAPGLWYGSRLGVGADFRSVRKLSPGVAARGRLPVYRGLGALGAGLIYKAVSTAHALGCREFLATVQMQNARFFQRLHWEPLEEISLHGLQHMRMRADLSHYRPAEAVF